MAPASTHREAVAYNGEQYISARCADGLSYHVDDDRQVVTIDAQASLFDQVILKRSEVEITCLLHPLGRLYDI